MAHNLGMLSAVRSVEKVFVSSPTRAAGILRYGELCYSSSGCYFDMVLQRGG